MDSMPASIRMFAQTRPVMTPIWKLLSALETFSVKQRVSESEVNKPVYVCGLPRSGTTITLEMLSQHPEIASHRSYQYAQPFLPYWLDRLYPLLPLGKDEPFERVHKDKLMVTRQSPDVVEEIFWTTFFKQLHTESSSDVLDASTANPAFESFYIDHIRKLQLSRHCTRYLTKNNYALTRIPYIKKLFPDARFIIVIRDPLHHIASYIKQDAIFSQLIESNSGWKSYLAGIGHYEFGSTRRLINFDDTNLCQEISEEWQTGNPVKACATYWNAAYEFVDEHIMNNDQISQDCTLLRYEDLCENSEETIDSILHFCDLNEPQFEKIRASYTQKLSKPTYYQPSFSDDDVELINTLTRQTAEKFGYKSLNRVSDTKKEGYLTAPFSSCDTQFISS